LLPDDEDMFSPEQVARVLAERPKPRKADAGLRARLMSKTSDMIEWTPIETGTTRIGVPDIYGVNKRTGESFWVECKKRDGKLSPGQIAWIRTHMRLQVPVFVVEDFMGGWMLLELGTDNILRGSSNRKMLDLLKASNHRNT
jgi:hypothetical protein